MKNNIKFFCTLAIIVFTGCSERLAPEHPQKLQDLVQYVDPFIGTGYHGHVFLGANIPFGAVQLGPTNITEGWDWCSGYHYSDSTLIGFAHTHLSGTGIGDLGDILFMPVTGSVNISRGSLENPEDGYLAFYKHEDETVKPGYYAVNIDRYKVKAELTASARVGFHKYSYQQGTDDAQVIIDLERGIGWDKPTQTYLEQVNDTLLVGYRYSTGWAKDQRIYFAAVFSNPILDLKLYENEQLAGNNALKGKAVKAVVKVDVSKHSETLIKVGISSVSTSNAIGNIHAEIPHWDFEQTASEAYGQWNRELNKIQIKTTREDHLRVFYTAMYHAMIAPSVFNDANYEYQGADNKVYMDSTFTNLTTFSLWDTYRAAHPLFTLFQPERVDDMINSMLNIYKQQGKLPVWHLMGNETNTMVGYSAVPVIVDAYRKGFKGFDPDLAYEAVRNTAMLEERGIGHVKEIGFIPADSTVESVAMGLEYAIADWCIAQMAKLKGKEEDFQYFNKRGQNYRNYFDPETRFMRGRVAENQWREPFDPFISKHMNDDFCEGNAWQYTWLVPHDVYGLMDLLGGEGLFEAKLDSLFLIERDMGEEASGDITGLIGQYAHGNEPSHHITYLYAFVGKPWKTAEKVRHILDSLYFDQPAGLSGNEDVGQMSSWYILSALGFYQVNPANGEFVLGSPLMDEATLALPNGGSFSIRAKNNNDKNIYIREAKLNGSPYHQSYLSYSTIMEGGELILEMGDKPNLNWGADRKNRPH